MQAANDSVENVIEFPNSAQHNDPSKHASMGSVFAWIIWVISALFVLFQFSLQLTSGVIVGDLMKSFSLTAFGGGLLASAYYYIYVVLQVPAGFLIDHFGSRRVLGMGAAACALGSVLFATATHVSLALIGRLLMGTGASFAFVGSMGLVARWFPLSRFGFMAAIAETIGMLGSMFGGLFLAHLVQRIGWRHSMEWAADIALIIAVLIFVVVRDAPKNAPVRVPQTRTALWSELKALLKKPVVWWNGLYSGAVFSIVAVFIALWAVPFIQKVHHLDLAKATLLCNLVFIGVAIGAPVLGWLDNRIRSRRVLLVGTAVMATIILCFIIFDTGLSVHAIAVLMVLLGVMSSSYVLSFIIANEVASENTRSTSMGITNMLSVITAPVFQPVIGLLLYLLSDHLQSGSLDAYSVGHFQVALSIVPLVVAIAAIIGFFLPNRKV